MNFSQTQTFEDMHTHVITRILFLESSLPTFVTLSLDKTIRIFTSDGPQERIETENCNMNGIVLPSKFKQYFAVVNMDSEGNCIPEKVSIFRKDKLKTNIMGAAEMVLDVAVSGDFIFVPDDGLRITRKNLQEVLK